MTTDSVSYRPIRPDDVQRLQAFHRRLSPEVVRLRFHSYLKELPDPLAHRFCEVDGHDRAAFVAVTGYPEQVVGVGRYDWMGDGVAEVAFVVQDEYQGHGIGKHLLDLIVEAARKREAQTLLARVLPGNTAMKQLLGQTGFSTRSRWEDGATSMWLDLPELTSPS